MGAVPFPAAGTEPIKGNASRSREIHHDRGPSLDRRPRLAVASFTPCAMIGTAAVALCTRVVPSRPAYREFWRAKGSGDQKYDRQRIGWNSPQAVDAQLGSTGAVWSLLPRCHRGVRARHEHD